MKLANWRDRAFSHLENESANNLSNLLGKSNSDGFPISLAKLLVRRGVDSFDKAKEFFRPNLSYLHNPFLMKDMKKAVDRLDAALGKNEKILIYGDYDVDGTTAVALVYGVLKNYTGNIDYYIPDRYSEGYGISRQGIDFAKDNGFSLVIALDCGIKANEKIDYALSLGVDFIICDHHTPSSEIPRAVAVLDPHREDCEYPYRYLSGCGVAFKFLQAFCIANNIDSKLVFQHIDLVAVSIASDIVPITGENRIIAKFGLKKLNENPTLGLKCVKDVCRLSEKRIDIGDIVFKIGPRINASGRIHSGKEVVALLVTDNNNVAVEKSIEIDSYNDERRGIDKTTTEEAKRYVEDKFNLDKKKSIVLYNPNWHKGIVGIVASRIAEEFCRPTIILTNSDDGTIGGSARSVDGFDLYNAIDSCANLLANFGGHAYAAGLSLKKENLDAFVDSFEQTVAKHIIPEQLMPQIDIDLEIKFSEITPKFIRILKQFAPFGPQNLTPIFLSKNLSDSNGKSKLIGKEKQHLRLVLTDDGGVSVFDGVAFCSNLMRNYNMADIENHLKNGGKIDICYSIEENFFNNNIYNQLMVRDIRMV